MHLFVFIEVDIMAWGGGGGRGNSLIPPVCFTCLCSSSFSSVGICCHHASCYSWPASFIYFCFDFYFLIDLCKHQRFCRTSQLVIAEVRSHLVLVLTIFPHLGASDQLVLLVQGRTKCVGYQMGRTTFHFILNCSSLHAALGK